VTTGRQVRGSRSVYKGKGIHYTSNTYDSAKYFLVKHDMFLGDVNACFLSLKKAVRDLHVLSTSSSHLQMGQPMIRYVYHVESTIGVYKQHQAGCCHRAIGPCNVPRT
jgi:hypothetical protein